MKRELNDLLDLAAFERKTPLVFFHSWELTLERFLAGRGMAFVDVKEDGWHRDLKFNLCRVMLASSLRASHPPWQFALWLDAGQSPALGRSCRT